MDGLLQVVLNSAHYAAFALPVYANFALAQKHYTWIGINFTGQRIKSIKFYFTLYDIDMGLVEAPDDLRHEFDQCKHLISDYHLKTPLLPGSGLTFTIKLGMDGSLESGFYFRSPQKAAEQVSKVMAALPHAHLKESDFDTGRGIYIMKKEGRVEEKTYLYAQSRGQFAHYGKVADIDFNACDTVEISAGNIAEADNAEGVKLIAMGGPHTITPALKPKIDAVLNELNEPFLSPSNCIVACPGYFINQDTHSIYLYGADMVTARNSDLIARLQAYLKD